MSFSASTDEIDHPLSIQTVSRPELVNSDLPNRLLKELDDQLLLAEKEVIQIDLANFVEN